MADALRDGLNFGGSTLQGGFQGGLTLPDVQRQIFAFQEPDLDLEALNPDYGEIESMDRPLMTVPGDESIVAGSHIPFNIVRRDTHGVLATPDRIQSFEALGAYLSVDLDHVHDRAQGYDARAAYIRFGGSLILQGSPIGNRYLSLVASIYDATPALHPNGPKTLPAIDVSLRGYYREILWTQALTASSEETATLQLESQRFPLDLLAMRRRAIQYQKDLAASPDHWWQQDYPDREPEPDRKYMSMDVGLFLHQSSGSTLRVLSGRMWFKMIGQIDDPELFSEV